MQERIRQYTSSILVIVLLDVILTNAL